VKTKKCCETGCFERAAEETIWEFEINLEYSFEGAVEEKTS